MGFFDTITELLEAALPWGEAQAEAPAAKEEEKDDEKTSSDDNKHEDEKEEESKDEPEEKEEEEPEEEEEEEEEETVDPKEKFEEECRESKQCSPAKHHFDECVERVTGAKDESDKKAPEEDCVEEFFHLAHCANQCAAPKLWSALK